jgi:hypothetical protein
MRIPRTFIGLALLAAAQPLSSGSAWAATDATTIVRNPEVDKDCDRFFSEVKAGQVDPALSALFATSPLWNGKVAERQAIGAQITAAQKIYGTMRAFELVQSSPLGTHALKRYYLVQYDNMVTRWELDFVHTGAGWAMAYIGFDDQVRTWF